MKILKSLNKTNNLSQPNFSNQINIFKTLMINSNNNRNKYKMISKKIKSKRCNDNNNILLNNKNQIIQNKSDKNIETIYKKINMKNKTISSKNINNNLDEISKLNKLKDNK